MTKRYLEWRGVVVFSGTPEQLAEKTQAEIEAAYERKMTWRFRRSVVANTAQVAAIVILLVYVWDKPPSFLLAAVFALLSVSHFARVDS